ncbi:hypothetical protein FB451DRAFT_1321944 [Mycena latifolia]|nr:hypothetical protein FB451DRAFT_1321944 [Mycena latifolia]
MLPPQLSPPSTNPARSRPRIVIPSAAPSVPHRSPHSCAYACPYESRSLPLGTLPPISHLPCTAAFASTANPACLRGARSRVLPSIRLRRSILESQRTRASPPRCPGEARPQGEDRGGKTEEGAGTDEGGGCPRARARVSACDTCEGRIGFDNRPGVDSTTGLVDIGLGIRWRLTLILQSPILPSPHPPPPQSLTPTANANASERIHSRAQTPRRAPMYLIRGYSPIFTLFKALSALNKDKKRRKAVNMGKYGFLGRKKVAFGPQRRKYGFLGEYGFLGLGGLFAPHI